MSIGSISSGAATWAVPTAGSAPVDPQTKRAQANAQADTLQALMGSRHANVAAARVSDGVGVDLYL